MRSEGRLKARVEGLKVRKEERDEGSSGKGKNKT